MISKISRRANFLLSVASLGANRYARMHLFLVCLGLYLRNIVPLIPKMTFRCAITCNYGACTLAVNDICHVWALHDIFIKKEYDAEVVPEPALIADLGSNIGLSAAFFALKFPIAHIHAVEPNPEAFALLCQNTALFRNITLHQYAIGEKSGSASFHVSKHDTGSSLFARASTNHSGISVKTISFLEFLNTIGGQRVDLLKFDIEGAEQYVIPFCTPDRVRIALGEMHYASIASDRLPAIRQALAAYCYDEQYFKKDRSMLIARTA